MDRMKHDVRIALRGFRRSPSFTITAVLILAIGIGMAVAMFTVFDAVLVRPLPVRDQDRLVELFTYRDDPKTDFWLPSDDLPKVAATSKTLREIAGVVHWGAVVAPLLDGDRLLAFNRTIVTGNFFDVLDSRPSLGRLLQPSDGAPGAEPVLVVSYNAWRTRFGGDSTIIGRRLLEPYTRSTYRIVGVAAPGLDYPAGVGVWMASWHPAGKVAVIAVARLAPNATMSAAQAEFFGTMKQLGPERGYVGVHIETFAHAVLGDVRPILVVLSAAVGLLLLIACVNVGNLLLLRAASRARELSIRRALGATYGDIVRQLVVESGLLGIAGGALGLLTAAALIRILLAYAPPQLPRTDVIGLTGTPVFIALAVTLVAVFVFGVIPAFVASHGQLASPLRFDSRSGTETRVRRRVRNALVASQVALALVMLAGAGLLGRSLDRLQHIRLGYTSERLSVLTMSFPPDLYQDSTGAFSEAKARVLGEQLSSALRAVPGVVALTPVVIPPFLGANVFVDRLDKEGQTPQEAAANALVPLEAGGAEYFRTFGTPIRAGRAFTDADRETAPPVAVVSEAIARRLWPNENPIGKRIRYWTRDSTAWRTVIGVAGDIRYRSLRESAPAVYLPWRQGFWQGSFAIRTTRDLSGVLPAIRRTTHEVNPQVTLWDAKTMDDLLAKPLAQPRLSALLLSGFAFVSMLLAAIGLYGVMSSAVRGNMRELGVRSALGASPERLRRGVLAHALTVTGAGATAGLVVALAASRLLARLLFEVSPADPIAMIGSTALLLVVALIAAYMPARRATRVDPVQALRSD